MPEGASCLVGPPPKYGQLPAEANDESQPHVGVRADAGAMDWTLPPETLRDLSVGEALLVVGAPPPTSPTPAR